MNSYLDETVLGVVAEGGVYIPAICHDPNLRYVGLRRVCLAEDQKAGILAVSCYLDTTRSGEQYAFCGSSQRHSAGVER